MSNTVELTLLPSNILEAVDDHGDKIYINPHVTANYNEDDEFIRIEGVQGGFIKIELSEIQTIDGNPFSGTFADLRAIIDPIIVSANSTGAGGGGSSNVTIDADNAGLAKEIQFTKKFTGYVIDVENPNNGNFNGFPINNIDDFLIRISDSSYQMSSNSISTNREILNTQQLAKLYNRLQNYYYFVAVSDKELGVLGGKLPIETFNTLEVLMDGEILEYQNLTYQLSPDEQSNIDDLALSQKLAYQQQTANRGALNREGTFPFPVLATPTVLSGFNPYREELIVRNNTNGVLQIRYSETTNPVLLVDPADYVEIKNTHAVKATVTGATSGTVIIVETI